MSERQIIKRLVAALTVTSGSLEEFLGARSDAELRSEYPEELQVLKQARSAIALGEAATA